MIPEAPPSASVPVSDPALLDDLLETSSSLYHRAIAKKQLELQAKLERVVCESRAWYRQEFARPEANAEYLNFIIWNHIQKVKSGLREELHEFMDAAAVQRAGLDQAIYIHCTPFLDA